MATSRNVDFTSVKDAGNFNRKRIPAGDYVATVTKVEDAEAKDGVFQYLFSIKVNSKPSSVFPYYCKLQENQLWKLRNLLIAAGLTVPKKRMKVDPNRAVGKIIGITVEDDEYDGKEQSTIAGVFPAAELSDFADGDDEPEDDESEEDEPDFNEEADAQPYAELDRNELKAEIRKHNPDFVAKKSQTDDELRDILVDLVADQGGDEDEEEEDEAPAPAPKRAAPKAKAKATAKKKPTEVSDEELEELDIDDL